MKVAWVWYSFLYWISPTFSNHLKFRWYHYKFCKERAEVFRTQLYLGEWKLDIERILAKYPKAVIPSHGYASILLMIEEQRVQEIVTFLESDKVEEGMTIFVEELNLLKNSNLNYLETLPIPNRSESPWSKKSLPDIQDLQENISSIHASAINSNEEGEGTDPLSNSDQIYTRTYVIATNIHYELHRTPAEYAALKKYTKEFEKVVKRLFHVDNLGDNLKKHKHFDYIDILRKGKPPQKGQLRVQLDQIISNPAIFEKDIRDHVKELIEIHFNPSDKAD